MATPTVIYLGAGIAAGMSSGDRSTFVSQNADASGDLGRTVESVLAALPGRHKQVYVISTDVWSQPITIDSILLRNVEKKKISQLIAYEAAPLSGLPATNTRTAVHLLEAKRLDTTYWVSQMDGGRFNQIADAVAFSGGKLAGVLHPAGLPTSVIASRGDWTRLEVWNDATVAVRKSGREVSVQYLDEPLMALPNTLAAIRNTLAEAEIRSPGQVEGLQETAGYDDFGYDEVTGDATSLSDEADYDFGGDSNPTNSHTNTSNTVSTVAVRTAEPTLRVPGVELSNAAELETFLGLWSQALKKTVGVPVIRAVRPQATSQTKRKYALALTAVTVVALATHFHLLGSWRKQQIQNQEQQVIALKQPIDAHAGNVKRLRDLESQLKAAQASAAELETQVESFQGQVDIHKSRVANLLTLLSKECPRQMMINSMTTDGDAIRVVGRCVDSASVSLFAETLGKKLERLTMTIELARCDAMLLIAGGGPYEFEFVIRDQS